MQFDFGQNWDDFSANALTKQSVEQAKKHFRELVNDETLANKSFIDIGFGQGLGLLTATTMQANTIGCDINPKCGQVLEKNQTRFFSEITNHIPVKIASILESGIVEELKNMNPKQKGKYDIVHSWGVLHHTGQMWKAIQNASELVAIDGKLIIAIYNKHWSSKPWLWIKWFYNIAPKLIKFLMIKFFYVIIYVAKFLVTFKNPLQKERGMSFYYDVIDWLGGYPYEYATIEELEKFISKSGFELINYTRCKTPIGCNELIFKKIA